MIVTIDGPTASGKSSTAKLLAQKLGFFYLNSGLLYRAVAYLLMQAKGYTIEALYNPTEQDLHILLDSQRITYTCNAVGNPQVEFDDADITPYLKGLEIDQAVPIVSANKLVRQLLLDVQRDIGAKHDLVIDGRDAGTVVFPQANFKFYLTAPLEIRAIRWIQDQQVRGVNVSFEQACKQIALRDERDMTRSIAPLVIPTDAIIVDNGLYSLNEIVDILYTWVFQLSLPFK